MALKNALHKFLHLLGFDEHNPDVLAYIDSVNMRISIPLCIYTLVIERFMYNRTVLLWGLISRKHYNLLFGILAVCAAQLLIVALLYVMGKFRNAIVSRASLYIYVFSCFIVGQLIAIYDYSIGKQVFVFLPMVAWVFALLLIHPFVSITGVYLSFFLIPAHANARIQLSTYVDRTLMAFAGMILIISLVRWIDQLNSARNAAKVLHMNETLKEISLKDELTGIKNRYGLRQDIEKLVNRKLVVVMSDIDEFKYYNDSYGHDTGDLVLQHMAKTLCSVFGRDSVYRFGGDEFLLVLPDWDQVQLMHAVAEWKAVFRNFEHDGKILHLGSTSGYTYGFCRDSEDISKMISTADARLYDGKMTHKGGSLGCEYDPSKPLDEDTLAKMEKELRSGEMDSLTKLPNMMYFRSKADLTVDILRTAGKQPVLAYFNLTNFKNYNRKYGLEAGDNLLVTFGAILSETFQDGLVCRFADDHFAVITTSGDIEQNVETIAEKIHKFGGSSNLSIRAGLYELKADSIDVSSACDYARQAMNSTKGNLVYRWYDEEMQRAVEQKQYIMDNFDKALKNGWIDVVYQPIIRSVNKYVCGMETLPRWNDPVHGVIEPEVYVPILEETRQIFNHDLFVLKHAVEDYLELKRSEYPVVPFVMNLSYRDFDREDIIDEILEITKDVDHGMVHFDLSASAIVKADDYVYKALNRLSEEGFQLWMDGYGSGNSTIDLLYNFRMHGIKIDIRSIHDIREGTNQSILLRHIISMCKEMGISTLALGVENETEEAFLISCGCEYLQGFWYSSIVEFADCISGAFASENPFEPRIQESYYTAIGRVDLSKPTMLGRKRSLDHIAEEIPAAICELRNGKYKVLRNNREFIHFLNSIQIPDLAAYEARMNDEKGNLKPRLDVMAQKIRTHDDWETMILGSEEKRCTGSFHIISEDPISDAFSILGVIVDMRMYQTKSSEKANA